jgi:phosphatidylserine decarboxylase
MSALHLKSSLVWSLPLSVFLLLASTDALAAGQCDKALNYLVTQYEQDPPTRAAFDKVYEGLVDLPAGYFYQGSPQNPWKTAGSGRGLLDKMVGLFDRWCSNSALPLITGDQDNALDPILYFAWVYYKNQAGQDFVQGRDPNHLGTQLVTGPTFLAQWNDQYRVFMDSPESTQVLPDWVNDPMIEIKDYTKTRVKQFKSWNQFFARNLKTNANGTYPSRPVTMPQRDYVIVSPTDCIMNPLVQVIKNDHHYLREFIENPLQLNTVLDVKNIPISVNDLLGSVPDELKNQFVGGSGLACVLMPNTYHHFHSPVDGTVMHAEVVKTGLPATPSTFGYPDFPNWVPLSGDVGRPGTDFSQFQANQRGVIIVKVEYGNLPGQTPKKLTGYVASIPVGLDSVGSVVLNTCDSQVTDRVNCFKLGGRVTKGKTKFGNFFYGGSLDILLFSKGMVSPAVQTRMGNQIAVINLGTAPISPWQPD